ncbi:hypothetical protein GS876_21020 [Rhodococcus hoagii]|nr:hypothetical protein [Prescottella equi]NKU31569.1 hypothetical protein [Prescottella equi]NKU51530.1 hypothetical protein [Prescottella equi]NKV19389.1 hypothetical protein [Prescottella equi]NKV67923.1 hypothetical protein [Prescottella equi]
MTTVRIEVSSPTLGDIDVKVGSAFTKPLDNAFMRRQIADLVADATKRVHGAYGITEDCTASTELEEARATIQRVHRLLQADEMGLKTYGITRDDLREALAGDE